MDANPRQERGGDEKESVWEINDEAVLLPKRE
jgi:hypothetical protein